MLILQNNHESHQLLTILNHIIFWIQTFYPFLQKMHEFIHIYLLWKECIGFLAINVYLFLVLYL